MLLQELGLENYVEIYSALRYNPGQNPAKPAIVKLVVGTQDQKTWVFQHLMKQVMNGNQRLAGITLADFVPRCFQAEQKDLENKAFRLRKLSKTFKPRIVVNDYGVSLKIYLKEKKKYHYYTPEEGDRIEKISEDRVHKPGLAKNTQVSAEPAVSKNSQASSQDSTKNNQISADQTVTKPKIQDQSKKS